VSSPAHRTAIPANAVSGAHYKETTVEFCCGVHDVSIFAQDLPQRRVCVSPDQNTVRLRGHTNLFLDTGIDNRAYTTIENTMINCILSAQAESGAYVRGRLWVRQIKTVVAKTVWGQLDKTGQDMLASTTRSRRRLSGAKCSPACGKGEKITRHIMTISSPLR
jgi:hypothetical protein